MLFSAHVVLILIHPEGGNIHIRNGNEMRTDGFNGLLGKECGG
jgi:hypothetical protein